MTNEEQIAYDLAVENHERAMARVAELEREVDRQTNNCLNLQQQIEDMKAQPSGVVLPEPMKAAIMRADDVLHALAGWESSSVKLEQRHGADWLKEIDAIRRELHTQLARLNQQPASGGVDERAAFEAWCSEEMGVPAADVIGAEGDVLSAAFSAGASWKARAALAQSADEVELALLREYRLSGIAFNDAQGEGYTVEQSNRAEARMEAAEKACWEFYRNGKSLAQSERVPEGWREFIQDCAGTAGGMVNGNRLSARAAELLAASPSPSKQGGE